MLEKHVGFFFLQFVNGCSPSGTRKGNLGRMETGLCMFPRQPGFDNSLVFLVDLLKWSDTVICHGCTYVVILHHALRSQCIVDKVERTRLHKKAWLCFCLQSGQETWAVWMSRTGNFSIWTRKNMIPVVWMDDQVVEVRLKKRQQTLLTCFLWICNKSFFPYLIT